MFRQRLVRELWMFIPQVTRYRLTRNLVNFIPSQCHLLLIFLRRALDPILRVLTS